MRNGRNWSKRVWKRKLQNDKGFSLLELVTAGALIALAASAGVFLMASAARMEGAGSVRQELEREAAAISGLLTEMIQEAEHLQLQEDAEEWLLISAGEFDDSRSAVRTWLRWEKKTGMLYLGSSGSEEKTICACVTALAVAGESGHYVSYAVCVQRQGEVVWIRSGATVRNTEAVLELRDSALSAGFG